MNRACGHTWIVATANPGKLVEIRTLLGTGFALRAQSELGIGPVEETGHSFIENALLKARHAALQSGLPSMADDSGLLVDALGAAPGLRSARYAGPAASDADNVAMLLRELRAVKPDRRTARFYCAMVALRGPEDPCPLLAIGQWHGRIADAPRGSQGFGYDPVFLDPDHGLTAAEMPAELKNRVSHRAQALTDLASQLGRA